MLMIRRNPQPVAPPSVETVPTPARIGLEKMTTLVTQRGEVEVVSAALPGARKHVVAALGDVRVVGENMEETVELKRPRDFCLLEWTGYAWRPLYGPGRSR